MPSAVIRRHLRPWVASIVGYDERMPTDAVHFGAPSPSATLVLAFTEPLDASWARDDAGHRYPGLVAGLHTRPALIRTHGIQHGVHLSLTPAGVRALCGLPAAELAGRMVEAGDLVPALELCRRRLEGMPSWPTRLSALQDALERIIGARRRGLEPDPFAQRCWDLIVASGGTIAIADLADEMRVSRRTVASRFRHEVGIGAKDAARIIRYDRSSRLWSAARAGAPLSPRTLAELAAACGYSDHAHLTREWRALGGQAPSRRETFPILQARDT